MEKKVKGNATEYILDGPLSERSQLFEQPIPKTLNQEIRINMEQVTSINSIGVKSWILWTSQIPRTVKLTLERCPYVVINQVNMIHGFIPDHTIIESFFAPFVCESCDYETVQLVSLEIGRAHV